MKYVRTDCGIYERVMVTRQVCDGEEVAVIRPYKVEFEPIIKQADTIEDLCDGFVMFCSKTDTHHFSKYENWYEMQTIAREHNDIDVYGAIWIEWGLKYVAKMNSEGEMELI